MYLSIYLFKIAKQNERPGNENSNEAWCFHGNRGAKVLKNMADLGDVWQNQSTSKELYQLHQLSL